MAEDHKNIIQGDIEIVIQAAFEMCDNGFPLCVAHRRQHPVRVNGVNVVEDKIALPVVEKDFNGFINRGAKTPHQA